MVSIWRSFLALAAACLVGACGAHEPPCPPSPVIRAVEFAPLDTIVLRADGSDNWPTTWGDDDALYTAWGDGWGFEPRTERKLSLGVARVTGDPDDFEGRNIRAPTIERTGNGPAGPKASGLLMVDGVLYMLVRNVDNARLAWSADRGATWTWGFRFETSFCSPSFLNFGRDYAGARDDFVYVYSPDGSDAYRSSDAIVMARVPKDRVRDQEAYEYFTGLDEQQRPAWSRSPGDRGAVFRDEARCGAVEVVHVPGIGRYLMTVAADGPGAWGLYDAPEPWGPWTTAFHTSDWDAGDTYSYVFPAKWIAEDGRTLHMVFSGLTDKRARYDAFCVRRVHLTIGEP